MRRASGSWYYQCNRRSGILASLERPEPTFSIKFHKSTHLISSKITKSNMQDFNTYLPHQIITPNEQNAYHPHPDHLPYTQYTPTLISGTPSSSRHLHPPRRSTTTRQPTNHPPRNRSHKESQRPVQTIHCGHPRRRAGLSMASKPSLEMMAASHLVLSVFLLCNCDMSMVSTSWAREVMASHWGTGGVVRCRYVDSGLQVLLLRFLWSSNMWETTVLLNILSLVLLILLAVLHSSLDQCNCFR